VKEETTVAIGISGNADLPAVALRHSGGSVGANAKL
jgi:hypothetical protein